jgi:uncharacterized membrane protein
MRKAVLAGLLALGGCEPANDTPQPGPSELLPSEPVPAVLPTAIPSPIAAPTPVQQMHFQAIGTEPFWLVEVLPGQLRYSSPEQLDGVTFAATSTSFGGGSRYTGTKDGAKVTLTIAPGKCSDGMSDQVYAYTAALTLGEQAMRGCARLN